MQIGTFMSYKFNQWQFLQAMSTSNNCSSTSIFHHLLQQCSTTPFCGPELCTSILEVLTTTPITFGHHHKVTRANFTEIQWSWTWYFNNTLTQISLKYTAVTTLCTIPLLISSSSQTIMITINPTWKLAPWCLIREPNRNYKYYNSNKF